MTAISDFENGYNKVEFRKIDCGNFDEESQNGHVVLIGQSDWRSSYGLQFWKFPK